jgi:hypothetical protein
MSNALAAIALIVSVLVAIAQFRQTHLQANRDIKVQQRVLAIEEARRNDEQRPRMSISVRYGQGEDVRLVWNNNGPVDLDDVRFEIIEKSAGGWIPLVGIRRIREQETLTSGSLGPMRIGEPASYPIVRTSGSEGEGGTARLRMKCTAGTRTWEFALECEIPSAALTG